MSTDILCPVAVGMAALSLLLQLIGAIASKQEASPIPAPLTPQVPSLNLKRTELLEHARQLKVGTASWRATARKSELLEAIRDHNAARRAA